MTSNPWYLENVSVIKSVESSSLIEFSCTIKTKVLAEESKKKGKDHELIQSSTTPDPGYQLESDNFTIRHHKRGPRGQPFPSR